MDLISQHLTHKLFGRLVVLCASTILFSSCSSDPNLETSGVSPRQISEYSEKSEDAYEGIPSFETTTGDVSLFGTNGNGFLSSCSVVPKNVGFQLTSNFSAGNALLLSGFFSGTEKHSKEHIELKLKALGFKDIEWIINNSKGVFSFIASRDEMTVVHFRGTSNVGGWIQDGKFLTRRANGKGPTGLITLDEGLGFKGWMHSGFYGSYHTVKKEFEDKLKKLGKGKPIYFAGHSLGGALTAIAAGRAKINGHDVRGLYTAGQPRIGDAEFSNDLFNKVGSVHFRLIFEDDIVARIPPTKLSADAFANIASRNQVLGTLAEATVKIAGYVHKAPQINLSNELNRLQIDTPSNILDLHFWEKWDALLSGVGKVLASKIISDHTSKNYACTLGIIIQKSK